MEGIQYANDGGNHKTWIKKKCFDYTKRKELIALAEYGTCNNISKSDVLQNANIFEGRILRAIKDEKSKNEVWKARFVVQECRNKPKKTWLYNAATVRQYSICVLFTSSPRIKFGIFSSHFTKFYLKWSKVLMREFFLKPFSELAFWEDKLFQLKIPHHGIVDSK